MNGVTDAVLVAGLKNKDEALTQLFMERYWNNSVRFALALTGNEAAAEDIAQEALIRALERLDTFQEGRAFRPWFLKIVENLARDHMRSETRRRQRQTLTESAKPLKGPLDSIETKEQADLIRHHLAQLDDDCRTIIALRFLENLSLKDISHSVNCPEGTVSSRIRRGLERLSRSLSPALSVTPGAVGALLTQLSEGQASQPAILNQDKGLFTWSAVSLVKALSLGLVLVIPLLGLTLILLPERPATESSITLSTQSRPRSLTKKGGKKSAENSASQGMRFNEGSPKQRPLIENNDPQINGGAKKGGMKKSEAVAAATRIERVVLRAVDGFNRPLVNFTLFLHRVREGNDTIEMDQLAQVKTDAYGVIECKLEPEDQLFRDGDELELQSRIAEFSQRFQVSQANAGELDLETVEIKRTHFGSLTLRLECQGRLLPGAKVTLLRMDPERRILSKRSFMEQGVSGEDGRVTLHLGQFLKESIPIRCNIVLKGYGFETRKLRLKKTQQEIIIELKPASSLKGRVLDGEGKAVKGAAVFVEQVNEWTETDELGRFELDHLAPDRSYQLRVKPPENSSLLPLTRRIKGDLGEQTWVLQRGTAIEVKAEWPRDLTFPSNAQLLLYGKTKEGVGVSEIMSFPGGQVTLPRVSPGRYVLKGYSFSGVSQGLSREFVVTRAMKSLNLTIRYERCRVVTGRIVDRQGQGIAGLSLNPSLGDRYAHTDEQGRFEFRTAPRGSFEIRVEGSESQLLKLIQVSPGTESYDLGEFMLERP